jgi:hypothetical protein
MLMLTQPFSTAESIASLHQHLPLTKSLAKAILRQSAIKTGPKPMFQELETDVSGTRDSRAEWVDQQTAHKMQVSRLSVMN